MTSTIKQSVISNENSSSIDPMTKSLKSNSSQEKKNSTTEKYLLNTGSISNKWLGTVGIVLIIGVLSVVIKRRK